VSIQARVRKLESAAAMKAGVDGGPLAIVIAPDFYGNAARLPNMPPRHVCPGWIDGTGCPICEGGTAIAWLARESRPAVSPDY